MKITKKLIALLLVAAMALSFAACNGDKTQDVATSGGNNVATPTPDVGGSGVINPEGVDMQGRVIKRMYWWAESEPDPNSSLAAEAQYNYNQSIYKMYNFTIKYVEGNYDTYVADIVKSVSSTQDGKNLKTDITDLAPKWLFPGLISAGYLYAWDDSQYLNANDEKWNSEVRDVCTYNGKVYGGWLMPFYARDVFYFNQTMFEIEGLTSLYTLMENKQWNWDKFEEYCKKLTQDTNGDSVTDIYAFGGSAIESHFIFNNGGKTLEYDENGRPVYCMDDAKTIEALQFFTDMQNAGYYASASPDGNTAWDWYVTDFANGKIAMLSFGFYQSKTFTGNETTPGTMADKHGIAAVPLGNSNLDGEYKWAVPDFNVTAILAASYNVEEVALAFDRLSTTEISKEYWEDQYESEVKDKETLAWVKKIFWEDVNEIDYLLIYTVTNDGWYDYSSRFLTEGVQSVIEEVKEAQQALLDDLFSNN